MQLIGEQGQKRQRAVSTLGSEGSAAVLCRPGSLPFAWQFQSQFRGDEGVQLILDLSSYPSPIDKNATTIAILD
jgi:hypothetical protein